MLTNIVLDVHCSGIHSNDPVYRVYVDDELLTERTWVWPAHEIYIKEHIEVDIDPGKHIVKIHNCSPDNSLKFKNVTVNKQEFAVTPTTEFTFYI